MAKLLKDYSGPFKPDLKWKDLSRDFLLKLIDVWQWQYVQQSTCYNDVLKQKVGQKITPELINDISYDAWCLLAERSFKRYPKLGNFQLNTIEDCIKVGQLAPDGSSTSLYDCEWNIKSHTHAVANITRCRTLEYYEQKAPEMIEPTCYKLEEALMKRYLLHPGIKVKPLKLPPLPPKQRDPDDIPVCAFDIKLEI